ncbi:MAG: NUDIX domain-containing protein [Patescibacteria group bacterium]
MDEKIRCLDHFGKVHEVSRDRCIVRVSVYGLCLKASTILLVKDARQNTYEFPGGGIHPDETMSEGLKREFLEETGCVVDVKDFYTVVEDFFYAENRVEVWHSFRFLYRVLYKEGKMKIDGNNDDVTSASFVDVKTLTEKNTKLSVLKVILSLNV